MEERALWRAVVRQAWSDALGAGIHTPLRPYARTRVLAWLGTPDFYEVCSLAGLNGAAVLNQFRKLFSRVDRSAPEDDRYHGLTTDIRDEVAFTQLDKPTYLDLLRRLGPRRGYNRLVADLDRGRYAKEALTDGD